MRPSQVRPPRRQGGKLWVGYAGGAGRARDWLVRPHRGQPHVGRQHAHSSRREASGVQVAVRRASRIASPRCAAASPARPVRSSIRSRYPAATGWHSANESHSLAYTGRSRERTPLDRPPIGKPRRAEPGVHPYAIRRIPGVSRYSSWSRSVADGRCARLPDRRFRAADIDRIAQCG
jgi:hypothetical protein